MPDPDIVEVKGVPTKAKAELIARTMRHMFPKWAVEILGESAPYTVRRSRPEEGRSVSTTKNKARSGQLGFLDFIALYESRGNYNARYGFAANQSDPSFTTMSVDGVLKWQEGLKFSACGKYQIIRATLEGLKKSLKLTGSELFDESIQDKMGVKLLERRGLGKFLSGSMAHEIFANLVAHEWAALPRVTPPHSEKSVYDGDGQNHALVDVKTYLNAIDELKKTS